MSINKQGLKKYVLDTYKEKHRSCGKCQQRWKTMKDTIKPLQQAPQFLEKRAQQSREVKDLLTMLWGDK